MNHNNNQTIPNIILCDLSSRFIINLPEKGKDLLSICYQIELAHWFYLDFHCVEEKKYPPVAIKDFMKQMFNHNPSLKDHSLNLNDIYDKWRNHKISIPTYGAMILNENMEKVILVQGYWSKVSWGFPKGKINEHEEDHKCAIREVLEEINFDISTYINLQNFIEATVNEQKIRLYIIPGVPEETIFRPRTRKEIRAIRWFVVNQLPQYKNDPNFISPGIETVNSFFMVSPFVKKLKQWIEASQPKLNDRQVVTTPNKNHNKHQKLNHGHPNNNLISNSPNHRHRNGNSQQVLPGHEKRNHNKASTNSGEDSNKGLPQNGLSNFSFFSQTWSTFTLDKNDLLNAFNFSK